MLPTVSGVVGACGPHPRRLAMWKTVFSIAGIVGLIIAAQAQGPAGRSFEVPYLDWPLLPSEQQYAAIDGQHLKQYVDDQTAISRRYRDHGHQFWGRIIGTDADAENAQWLLEKFRKIGLSEVREQSLNLPPQWMPTSWSVTAT